MSEHLVHSAVLRDSFRLVVSLPNTSKRLRHIIEQYQKFATLGCITVSGDSFSFRLLERYREKELKNDPYLDAKLAFVLGWVSHRACDRVMKPIWREAQFKGRGTDVDTAISPYECSIYQEAEAYKLFFNGELDYEYALFADRLQAFADTLDLQQEPAYKMVQCAYAMNLMNIQTISEDQPVQKRFEEICMRLQKFYVDINRYSRAIETPDPGLHAEYVDNIHWYDPEDKIIMAAQQLRNNVQVDPTDIQSVLQFQPASYYGQALGLSVQYIMSADQYLQDKLLDMNWLKEKLDIGKLGPDGLHV